LEVREGMAEEADKKGLMMCGWRLIIVASSGLDVFSK
jgi:hypothetical protein